MKTEAINGAPYRFKTILNFRDIGGIPVDGGKRLKRGIIYRSANPDRLSRKEEKILRDLGIATIIDLRAAREVRKNRKGLGNINIVSLPLDFELRTREKLKPYLHRKNSEEAIADLSNELYLEILDASLPVIRKIIEILLNAGNTPVLIHCQAGKDRTGIIAALLQLLGGAPRQAIVNEFLKSNDELLPFFKKMLLIRRIISFGFFPSDTILFAITVRERNIGSVVDRVMNRYCGIDSFLRSAGLDQSQINSMKEILVEN